MPSVRSSASKRYTYIVAVILLLSKNMPTYSYYILKGLVCVVIIALFSRQPSSYTKYTKLNMYSCCDIRSVSTTKCILLVRLTNL